MEDSRVTHYKNATVAKESVCGRTNGVVLEHRTSFALAGNKCHFCHKFFEDMREIERLKSLLTRGMEK